MAPLFSWNIDSAKEFFAFQYNYQVGAREIKKIHW